MLGLKKTERDRQTGRFAGSRTIHTVSVIVLFALII